MKLPKLTKIILITVFLILSTYLYAAEQPLTTAESSGYTSTSTYKDVMDFIIQLQKQDSRIRMETICVSTEGRKIPLLVIGDPLPACPLDLKYDDRAVVYFQANIHAGEVEGKEASLMLARDLLAKKHQPLLDELVVLVCPIFNADGNEKISTENRKKQHGPVNGVGVRYNGQKLDLNRDGIKLESPEVRGLVKNVFNRWDPLLFVDCHTTNGSYHEEPVTYTWGVNPNGDVSLIDYTQSKLMPFVQKNLKEKYGILSIPYGNFMDFKNPEKGWAMAGPECRYLTNYTGLRNRFSILNENYSYADYKTRVLGCYGFLYSFLEYFHKNKTEIVQLIRTADKNTIARGSAPAEDDQFHIEYEAQAYDEPVEILGWETEFVPDAKFWPPVKKLDKKRTYKLPYYCKYEPSRSVSFPFGWFITAKNPAVVQNLLNHGILVEQLTADLSIEIQSFQLTELKSGKHPFQGHHLNSVKGEYKIEEKSFSTGTIFVPAAQRLGSLAAYLLEPESEDGLLVWNFFDLHLLSQWRRELQIVPVFKLLKPASFAREKIQSF